MRNPTIFVKVQRENQRNGYQSQTRPEKERSMRSTQKARNKRGRRKGSRKLRERRKGTRSARLVQGGRRRQDASDWLLGALPFQKEVAGIT